MARGYANYSLPSPESKQYRTARTWMSARLHELAWMSQGFVEAAPGGPEWVFHRDGKEVTTKPGLTLISADGQTSYWSALERRFTGEVPDWMRVQQFHAERLGASTWLLTDDFIQGNAIEFTNRTDSFYFLAHARGWDSSAVECDLLMAVHRNALTLEQLAAKLELSVSQVKAAVLRLWRQRLVELPMKTEPLNDRWLVRGAPHGNR
jgi:hypothetical protein